MRLYPPPTPIALQGTCEIAPPRMKTKPAKALPTPLAVTPRSTPLRTCCRHTVNRAVLHALATCSHRRCPLIRRHPSGSGSHCDVLVVQEHERVSTGAKETASGHQNLRVVAGTEIQAVQMEMTGRASTLATTALEHGWATAPLGSQCHHRYRRLVSPLKAAQW